MVLGLVTSKRPKLEPAEALKQRIAEASRYFPRERLGISPQCGFSSSIIGNRLTAVDQKRKLELVASTARAVWGED